MFPWKKICSMSRAHQLLNIKERPGMISTLVRYRQPIPHVVGGMDFSARFKSSGRKVMDITLVNLAYKSYEEEDSDCTIPIIILHGLLGSKSNWNSMAKAILKNTKRKVYAIDARNHGESPHVNNFSYGLMVCDLVKFMRDQNITRASFIGHSLGGRVSMLLALMWPELVKSIIVVDISPIGHSPKMLNLSRLFETLMNLDLHPHLTVSEARRQVSAQLKEKQQDDQLIGFLLTNLIENRGDTNWRWKFNLNSIAKHFESEVCRFPLIKTHSQTRTLFIAGANSDYIRPVDEWLIRKVFSDAEFAYVPGAGHWVHAEMPHKFLFIVSEFLKRE